jgi:hypothetical protein
MRHILPFVLVILSASGCGDKKGQTDSSDASLPAVRGATSSSSDIDDYATQWEAATPQERQGLADLNKVSQLFLGADKEKIEEVFGPADQSGIDDFGMDVMRYELGTLKDMDGQKAHLTFVFEKGVVTSVMGNSISF